MAEKLCYVVRPSRVSLEAWRWVLSELIEPVMRDKGFTCELGPPLGERRAKIQSIIEKLDRADLVVVDVTGCDDPTVFYQLGVRHARSSRTVLIAQSDEDILRDFAAYYVIIYSSEGRDFEGFRKEFQGVMEKIEADPEAPDNPVQEYLQSGKKLIDQALQEYQAELERTRQENQQLWNKIEKLEQTLKDFTNPSGRDRIKFIRVK